MNKKIFKKKGFLLIEGVLQVAVLSLLAIGCSALFSNQFSILSASKVGNQAREVAEVEADYLKTLGYDDLDSGEHAQKSLAWLLGRSKLGDEYESKVTIDDPIIVSDDNEIKIAHIDVYKAGENTSRYSLEVPLSSSQSGGLGVPDYAHGIAIGSGTEIKEDGWIRCYFYGDNGAYMNVYVNNISVWTGQCDTSYFSTTITGWFPVCKGDIVQYYGSQGGRGDGRYGISFYPNLK